jgi:5'-3' exonuclease
LRVHLVDGTYELFRHYFAVPKSAGSKREEVAATRGVLNSMLSLLDSGATHVGVATDHVIESFRNDLYVGYKTGEGIPEDLFSQFQLLEDALNSMGVLVWDMIEFEADDALAAAAAKAAQDQRVEQVIICTPDKDLSQCVVGDRVVQLDRMRNVTRNEAAVVEKFGVLPESIPDYLAVVGDTADGYPGLSGWGAKASAAVLSEYKHFENIPKDAGRWPPTVRGAKKLAATLQEFWQDALLFRTLATLRTDVDVFDDVEELRWQGPREDFESMCEKLRAPDLYKRAMALSSSRPIIAR